MHIVMLAHHWCAVILVWSAHQTFYSVHSCTTILASGYFTRTVTVMNLLDERQICIHVLNHWERIDLSYIGIFIVQYSLLFFYPCLWAAFIAVAQELIQKVMSRHWVMIPLSEKEHFVQYLMTQNFSFWMSIFCMHCKNWMVVLT